MLSSIATLERVTHWIHKWENKLIFNKNWDNFRKKIGALNHTTHQGISLTISTEKYFFMSTRKQLYLKKRLRFSWTTDSIT